MFTVNKCVLVRHIASGKVGFFLSGEW